jgi:hypothetical protein
MGKKSPLCGNSTITIAFLDASILLHTINRPSSTGLKKANNNKALKCTGSVEIKNTVNVLMK